MKEDVQDHLVFSPSLISMSFFSKRKHWGDGDTLVCLFQGFPWRNLQLTFIHTNRQAVFTVRWVLSVQSSFHHKSNILYIFPKVTGTLKFLDVTDMCESWNDYWHQIFGRCRDKLLFFLSCCRKSWKRAGTGKYLHFGSDQSAKSLLVQLIFLHLTLWCPDKTSTHSSKCQNLLGLKNGL